jgi:predicted ATPase
MRFSRLSLQNWKNFKNADAQLENRAFLIGPNASGKSNFLDAIRFLKEVATSGLSHAVQSRGGVSQLRCLAARESPSIVIEATITNDSGRDAWLYKIEFNQDANRTPILRTEYVKDLKHSIVLVNRPDEGDNTDPLRLTQTALEQIVVNKDFRQIADFLSTISYQHLLPQVVRDPKSFSPSPVTNDPYGRDLLLRIYGTDSVVCNARLKRIAYVLQQAVPLLISLEIDMDSRGSPHLIGRYKHWRSHDAKQNESQFSDGTLRLFGLMWAMLEGNGPLLMEEPELSLHPEVVRNLHQMLVRLQDEMRKMKRKKGFFERQIIISTRVQ